MSRKPSNGLPEGISGQHVSLAVAAHLARTQLVPEPLKPYRRRAPVRHARIDGAGAGPHRGAARDRCADWGDPRDQPASWKARRAAWRDPLVLKDGRTLGTVSVKRADLRQAIAILKPSACRSSRVAAARSRREAWAQRQRRSAASTLCRGRGTAQAAAAARSGHPRQGGRGVDRAPRPAGPRRQPGDAADERAA